MKQPQKAAPTAAQLAVWHGVQSAGLAGIISILVGTGQFLSTGNINVNALLTVLGASFVGALGMVYKSVSSNPNLAQAALDTANEAIQRVEAIAPSWLNQDIQKIQKPAPKPITYAPQPPAQPQQQSGGGGMPADYYSRYQRPSIPDMATQGYVPAVNPGQSMLGTFNLANLAAQQTGATNQPPAQQNQFNPQQGG